MAENNVNTPYQANEGMVMMEKSIKKCDESNLFSFLLSHFHNFFIDVQELRSFIEYLRKDKADLIVKDLLNNFNVFLKSFKENK